MAESEFDLSSRLDLGFLGESWKDCYIDFKPATYEEAKEVQEMEVNRNDPNDPENLRVLADFLGKRFISGKAMKKGQKVDLSPEDMIKLPLTVLKKSMDTIRGDIDPN